MYAVDSRVCEIWLELLVSLCNKILLEMEKINWICCTVKDKGTETN
jgi:hypothetical protein